MITLTGLTDKQIALCDIMWTIQTLEGVEAFIKTLPAASANECRSLIQLMILELNDKVNETEEAQSILNQFKL